MDLIEDDLPVNESLVRYAVIKSVEWFRKALGRGEDLISVEDFNDQNNFTKSKILKIPFFMVMGGNGGTHALYNEFGPFYAITSGPSSIRLNNFWDNILKPTDFGFKLAGTNGRLIIEDEALFNSVPNLDPDLKLKVDYAFKNLKGSAFDLIKFSDFELLVMCHQFEASYVYRLNNNKDFKILADEIERDGKRTFFATSQIQNYQTHSNQI